MAEETNWRDPIAVLTGVGAALGILWKSFRRTRSAYDSDTAEALRKIRSDFANLERSVTQQIEDIRSDMRALEGAQNDHTTLLNQGLDSVVQAVQNLRRLIALSTQPQDATNQQPRQG